MRWVRLDPAGELLCDIRLLQVGRWVGMRKGGLGGWVVGWAGGRRPGMRSLLVPTKHAAGVPSSASA